MPRKSALAPSASPPSRMQTVTVSDLNILAYHAEAWDRLAWKAPQKISTVSHSWVDAFFRHRIKNEERWLCSFAYEDHKLVGVLPLVVAPHRILGKRWPVLHTPSDEHTPSGDIALAPYHAAAAFRALLVEVGRQVPNHLALDFRAVRRSSALWQALEGGLQGYFFLHGQRSLYSYLDVRGDFDSYFEGLGQIRRNLGRFRRKLERLGSISIEMKKGFAANEDFLHEFLVLEASGWKNRNGTAILNDPNLVAFYTTLVRNVSVRGNLEWHAIRVNSRLVAAEMCIRCGASLTQPKQAFDEEFADCRPGHILRGETIKDAFSRPEIIEFNPMSDAEAHRMWQMPREEYVDVHLVRQGALRP